MGRRARLIFLVFDSHLNQIASTAHLLFDGASSMERGGEEMRAYAHHIQRMIRRVRDAHDG